MTVLRSYLSTAWTAQADDGRPVLDAVTSEEVTRVHRARIAAARAGARPSG